MPTVRIPLAGTYNQRGLDVDATLAANKDQRFKNCTFDVVRNPITGGATLYVEKRPGWGVDSVIASGEQSTGFIKPQNMDVAITAYGNTNSTIYYGQTSVGAITGRALYFKETIISAKTHVVIRSSDGTGWYYVDGAKDQTSYTGDTNSNTTVDNIASTAGMYSGQAISGTDIPAGTRIATVDSGTQITLDTAATGTTAGVTLTKTPIAKIISANFVTTGTDISGFEEMDGYLFYATDDGNLRNSNLNSVTGYTVIDSLAVNMAPDPPVAVARHKNVIMVFGKNSREAFFNAGNPSGSPLQRTPQFFERIGAISQQSITTLENDIYFVGAAGFGNVGVWRVRDMNITKVSTPTIDDILGTASATGLTAYASGFRMGGYSYAAFALHVVVEGDQSILLELGDLLLLESGDEILLEASTEEATFSRMVVYNADLNIWSEWDATQATFIVGAAAGVLNQIMATSRSLTSGKLYLINPAAQGDLYQDDGAAFTMEIRTSRVDHGTPVRKVINSIRLIGDKQSTGKAYLSWSDDDYGNFSAEREFDMTRMEPKVTRCGTHRGGRVYKLRHTDNAAFRAEALEIEYEIAA